MKLLAVFFLVGLALAHAVPVPSSQEISLEDVEELDSLLSSLQADDDEKSEFEEKLRKHLDEILEKVKDTLEKGKDVKEDIIKKMKEIREKLKDLKVDISAKAKDLMEKIKEKAKDFWKRIFEKKEKEARGIREDIQEKMKKMFETMLEKAKDYLEQGKTIGESLITKMKDLREKYGSGELDQKARDLMNKLSDKAKEAYKKILERIGVDTSDTEYAEESRSMKDDIQERLKAVYDRVLERIRTNLEKGKSIGSKAIEKLREVMDKYGAGNGNVSDLKEKARQLREKLSDNAKAMYDKILEKLGINNDAGYAEGNDVDEIKQRLKKSYDEILEKIKEMIENGKTVKDDVITKAKEIQEKLKDLRVEISNKAKDLINKIKEKSKNFWKDLFDKFGNRDERALVLSADDDDVSAQLREKFEEIVKKIKDAFENNQNFRDGLEKLKEIRQRIKDLSIELGDKGRDLVKKLREKVTEYLKTFLDRFTDKRAVDFKDMLKKLKEKIKESFDVEKIKKNIEEIFGKGNEVSDQLIQKLKDKSGTVKQKILDFIDRILESKEKRAVDFKDMLKKLKDKIKESFDVEKIKKNIEEIFGKGNEVSDQLLQKLKDKSGTVKQKILDFIDRILEQKEKRSVKEVYEKIKNYFKDLQIDLKEKFTKFGEYAKDKYEKGLESGKDKLENLKKLAREFINDTNIMRKDVAEQAKDFFREYKDDLGVIYDEVKEKVRDILKRD